MTHDFILSDVDGTLLTPAHEVTARSRLAIDAYRAAGGRFTVASSRPPLGLRKVAEAAALDLPFAAFNGGLILRADFSVIEEHALPAADALRALGELEELGLETWLYRGTEWWVRDAAGARVEREARAVGFAPAVTSSLEPLAEGALKIVGVSLDTELVARAEAELRTRWAGRAQVSRSHASYVDITHLNANKGYALGRLAALAGRDSARSLVVGDMPNDVDMFRLAGFSVAMGNAPEDVKAKASAVTASNGEEGFALAVEKWGLGISAVPFYP